MSGRVHALLVGIDDYPSPVPPLSGCVNDVRAFAEILTARVDAADLSLVVLTDEDATRAAVLDGFRHHLAQAGAADVALFYYSGHGAHQAAPPGALGPRARPRERDARARRQPQRSGWDLADKELAALLAQVCATGCHVLVVLDCCHSGDGTRDVGEVVRQAPADERARPSTASSPGALELATALDAAAASGPPPPVTRALDQAPGPAGAPRPAATSSSPRAARRRRPRR